MFFHIKLREGEREGGRREESRELRLGQEREKERFMVKKRVHKVRDMQKW